TDHRREQSPKVHQRRAQLSLEPPSNDEVRARRLRSSAARALRITPASQRGLEKSGVEQGTELTPGLGADEPRVAGSPNQARIASTGETRAARRAGKKPPRMPMAAPNTNAMASSSGFGSKPNVTSWKVAKFIIETSANESRNAEKSPQSPPIEARTTASRRNENKIEVREKPSARSVPISRCRCATAAFIVMVAPIIAPIEKKIVITIPSAHTKMLVPCDCFS